MPIANPSFAAVLLFFLGLFMASASAITFIPALAHDRVVEQFMPVWNLIIRTLFGEPDPGFVLLLARLSQIAVGTAEAAIAALLLAAALVSRRRPTLANLGLSAAAAMFGLFLVILFLIHDKTLPWWNQYPPILAWIGVTWLVVAFSESGAQRRGKASIRP